MGRLATLVVILLAVFQVECEKPAYSNESIRDIITARCGESGAAVWKYEGSLYDPMDGQKICSVEGVEIVRYLGAKLENERRSSLQSKYLPGYTMLSRKLFCYKDHDQPKKLLTSFRLRRNSPKRLIPTSQAVAIYDTATTMFNQRNGTRLVCHTEMGDGSCFWSASEGAAKANSVLDEGTRTFDFSLYTRKKQKLLPELNEETESGNIGVVVTPKRSRLVQFGPSEGSQEGRFGARETYSYLLEPKQQPPRWRFWLRDTSPLVPECTLKYTRYGEGPPWYGPGRYCTLELTGRRLNGISEIPPVVATFAAQNVPGFMAASTPITSEEEAKEALRWFRESPKLWSEFDRDNSTKALWRERLNFALQRIRMASTHKPVLVSPEH